MDGHRFDALTRGLARSRSRRGIIGTLAGAIFGGIGANAVDARVCSAAGTICREHADCCSKSCGTKDRTGRRYCLCQSPTDCPSPPTCRTATCVAGSCGTSIAVGTTCNDGNPCTTTDLCNASGQCVGTPVANGTSCPLPGGGTGFCTGGVCLPCSGPGGTCPNGNSDCCGAAGELICETGECCIPNTPEARTCTNDVECCAGLFCDEQSGNCVPNGSLILGDDCEDDTDCASGACGTDDAVAICCRATGTACTVGSTDCCSGICHGFGEVGSAGTCIARGSIQDQTRCSFGGTAYDDACTSGRCQFRGGGNWFCCTVDIGETCSATQFCCNASPDDAVDCCEGTCVEFLGCDPDNTQLVCGCTDNV